MVALYSDIGSGLNDKRKGLIKLIKNIPVLYPAKIIVTYRDRLARLGTTIIEVIGEIFGLQIETTNIYKESQSFEDQLTSDMIALVTSFAGKLHRARRGK